MKKVAIFFILASSSLFVSQSISAKTLVPLPPGGPTIAKPFTGEICRIMADGRCVCTPIK